MTEMFPVVVNGRYEIVLPKHRAEMAAWYSAEGWEKARINALTSVIAQQDNPVVYYAGAEQGDIPAICAMQGAEMFLFEPSPQVWSTIRVIWEANGLETPWCFEGFASNTSAPLGEVVRREWPAHAFEEVGGDQGFKELQYEAAKYPQIRLDDVPAVPTIITFDVEGAEWEVLRGAEQTLLEHRPVIFASIHPEFLFNYWGEYSRNLRDWITDRGYRETILDYQHELHCMYEPR